MKKTFAITALALIALTGCSTNQDAPQETTAPTTQTTTSAQPTKTPTPKETTITEATPTTTEEPTRNTTPDTNTSNLTAHVADNGDITWTDKDGNPVPEVSWETVNNYPFTQEELAKIQGGLEAEFADPAATGAPGELVDHSDTPIQSDEEIAERLKSDYDQYSDEMNQQNMDSATSDDEYAQAYCTGDTSSPEFDTEYCAAHGF